jgi:Ca2+-binding EF-hand superfamily protein
MFRLEIGSTAILALAVVGGAAFALQDGAAPRPAGASPAASDGPTSSASQRDSRDRLFEQLDGDADGTITLDEIPEPLRERMRPLFERLGKDAIVRKDLDAAGAQARPAKRAARGPAIFQVLDEDGDGRISREELSRAGEKFNELDEDGSGEITLDEVFSLPGGFVLPEPREAEPENSRPDAARDERGPRARPAESPALEPRAGNGALVDRLFRRYDEDRDGRLSREEAPAKLRQHFESFDASQDDWIDRDEFEGVVTRVTGERSVGRRE